MPWKSFGWPRSIVDVIRRQRESRRFLRSLYPRVARTVERLNDGTESLDLRDLHLFSPDSSSSVVFSNDAIPSQTDAADNSNSFRPRPFVPPPLVVDLTDRDHNRLILTDDDDANDVDVTSTIPILQAQPSDEMLQHDDNDDDSVQQTERE